MNAKQNPEQLTEAEVRALRDEVYGHHGTDENWDRCRESWMQPANVLWLLSQKNKTARTPRNKIGGGIFNPFVSTTKRSWWKRLLFLAGSPRNAE